VIAKSPNEDCRPAGNCAECQAELPSYFCALHRGAKIGAKFDAVAMHLLTCLQCRRLAWDTFVAMGWRDQLAPVCVPPLDLAFLHTGS
jgi:hypothetical protein